MQIQTVFRAGNSNVVSVSQKFPIGEKVMVVDSPDGDGILIKKVGKNKSEKSSATTKEFNRWLSNVLKEDAGVLNELADR